MPGRVRLVAVVVHVEAVADDGEHLTPLPIDPVRVHAADWETWATTGLPVALKLLEEQLAEAPNE